MTNVLEHIYIPRALNTGAPINCLRAHKPTQEKFGRGFGKNAGECIGRVEKNCKEEIPGSRRSMHWLYTDLLQGQQGELSSSVF